jgi:hypothetical protein
MTVRKVPKEAKVVLVQECLALLQELYPHEPTKAIEYLLIFFTGVDLVGIREELTEAKRARALAKKIGLN